MNEHTHSLSLYIELLTNEQDERVLDLLYFPALRNSTSPLKFKVRDQGRSRTRQVKGLSSLISSLKNERSSEVTLSRAIADGDGTEEVIDQTLILSPTCSLWRPTSEWELGRPSIRDREHATLQVRENYLKWNEIAMYPSRLISTISLRGPTNLEEAYGWAARFLRGYFPGECANEKIVGGGGIDVFDEATRDYIALTPRVDALMHLWPKALTLLGGKFGVLQPLMLGNLALCESIHEDLGQASELFELPLSKSSVPFGLLHIQQSAIDQRAKTDWANPSLAPRDETTARKIR